MILSKKISRNKLQKFPEAFATNIRELLAQQKRREQETPWYLRFTEPAIKFFGSVWFLWINILIFAVWICVNVIPFYGIKAFDPYPFEFLTLSVSLEAIVLSVIVLISQAKLQNDSDERAQLDLHINLLTESETTLILKKLERIERTLNIEVQAEEEKRVHDLIQETKPERLAEFIHQTFCPYNKTNLSKDEI